MNRVLYLTLLIIVFFITDSSMANEREKIDLSIPGVASATTVCMENHVFIIASLNVKNGGGISVAQVFEEREGKSVPKKCD